MRKLEARVSFISAVGHFEQRRRCIDVCSHFVDIYRDPLVLQGRVCYAKELVGFSEPCNSFDGAWVGGVSPQLRVPQCVRDEAAVDDDSVFANNKRRKDVVSPSRGCLSVVGP